MITPPTPPAPSCCFLFVFKPSKLFGMYALIPVSSSSPPPPPPPPPIRKPVINEKRAKLMSELKATLKKRGIAK